METDFVFGNRELLIDILSSEVEEMSTQEVSYLESLQSWNELKFTHEDYTHFKKQGSSDDLDDVMHVMARSLISRSVDLKQSKASYKATVQSYLVGCGTTSFYFFGPDASTLVHREQ